jgi:hypothetical protein
MKNYVSVSPKFPPVGGVCFPDVLCEQVFCAHM